MALWTPSNGSADFAASGATAHAGYRADQSSEITQSGGLVSQWDDWLGGGHHVDATGSGRPTYSATAFPGSLPGITFSQSSQTGLSLVSGLGISTDTLVSVFAVALLKTSPGGIYNRLVSLARLGDIDDFSDGGSYIPLLRHNNFDSLEAYAGGDTASAAITQNVGFVAAQIQAATTLQTFVNGAGGSAFTKTPNYAWDELGIGQRATGANTDCWDGVISEVLIVTGTVTPTLRQLIEGYLAWKWGTQASLPSGHPYLSAAPTVSGGGAVEALAVAASAISVAGSQVQAATDASARAIESNISIAGDVGTAAIDSRAAAVAGHMIVAGAIGFVASDAHAVATSGHVLLVGHPAFATASGHQESFAASGAASVVGWQSIASAGDDKLSLALAGNVSVTGAAPNVVASDNKQVVALSGQISIIGHPGIVVTAASVALAVVGSVSIFGSAGIAAATTGTGTGPTTLDPASIVNFSGTGTLSNGNLTFSSTGISFVLSTRRATGKQTFECNDFLSVRNSVNGSGFLFDHDGSNWLLEDAAGNVLATGPSTPAPVAGGIFTIDCDRPNELVSMRYNGTPVFSNEGVSGIGLSTWKVQLFASSGRSPTVAFSNLTYAPLAGFSEWDTAGVALASAGSADVYGAVAQAATTAHVNAIASPASVEALGAIGIAVASDHVSAVATPGQVAAAGQTTLAIASDHQKAFATDGSVSAFGSQPVAGVSDHKSAITTAGSVHIVGAVGYAVDSPNRFAFASAGSVSIAGTNCLAKASDKQEVFASVGSISIIGQAGLATTDKIVIASAGHIRVEGQGAFAFASDHQEATALAGNLSVAGSQPTSNVTDHKFALASSGSIAMVGATPDATAGRRAIAYSGAVSIMGAQPTAVASRHVRALAATGRVALVGRRSRAFSMMSKVPASQTAFALAENRSSIVPQERRTSIVAPDTKSTAAPERRRSTA